MKIREFGSCRAGVVVRTQGKRLLVLGSSSRVGRLLRHLRPDGIAGWHTQWHSRDANGSLDFGSLSTYDAVLALWGVVPGAGDQEDNSRLAQTAMEIGLATGATRVLHCSSAAVYGRSDLSHQEVETAAPFAPYGHAKRQMEKIVAEWAYAHPEGPKPCMLRIANVVGADSLFSALALNAPVTLDRFADGQGPWRSYCTPMLLARTIDALVELPQVDLPDVVNVAGKHPVAMEALVQAAGRDVLWRDAPDTAVPRVALDTERLAQWVDMKANEETPDALIQQWLDTRKALT